MDPDFIREASVMAGFIGLYIFGSIYLLKGHKTDLSAVGAHGATHHSEGGAPTPQRLNRRRKAIAREQGGKSPE
jgi:hypothetical protein